MKPLRVVSSARSEPEPPYPADIRARGWAFWIDMERVTQSMTWLHCPAEMRPWLLMLWASSWGQAPCGTLPDDDIDISVIIGIPPNLFAAHRHVLMRGWERHADGRLYHRVITEGVMKMIDARKADRERQKRHREAIVEKRETQPSRSVTRESRVSHGTGTGTGTGEKQNTAQPDGFAEWWAAYPRKTDRQAAMKAWRSLNPDPPLRHVLLAAVEAQKRSDQWRRGILPHGATWLNRRRWEDEIASPTKPDGWIES